MELAARMLSVHIPLVVLLFVLAVASANDTENFRCLDECLYQRHAHIDQLLKPHNEHNNTSKAEAFCESFNQSLFCATSECPTGRPSEFLQSKLPSFLNRRCPENGSFDEAFFAEFDAITEEVKERAPMAPCDHSIPIRGHPDESCERYICIVDKFVTPLTNKYDSEAVAAYTDYLKFWKVSKITRKNQLDTITPKCLALLENNPNGTAERSIPVAKEKENFLCLRECLTPARRPHENATYAQVLCQAAGRVYRCATQECPEGKASEFIRRKVPEHFGGHCVDTSAEEEFFTELQNMEKEARTFIKDNCLSDLPPHSVSDNGNENICRSLNKCLEKMTSHFTEKYGAEVVAAVVDREKFDTLNSIAYQTDHQEEFAQNCLALLDTSSHF